MATIPHLIFPPPTGLLLGYYQVIQPTKPSSDPVFPTVRTASRFIFKYNYMLEIDAFDALRQLIRRDYETFSGKMLENYFKEKLAEEQQFTRIDNWWSRNGKTEIDIIAINELTQQAAFYEVKRQAKELDSSALETHVSEFLIATRQLKKHTISYFGLSMQDM